MNSSLLRRAAEVAHISTNGLLATIECSFCRSLCNPRPLAARCSRITAIHRWLPSWPPYFARQREAQMAGAVGAPPHFGQQRLPFAARQAAAVEVGARPFAAVIEEALVVVLRLQRRDLAAR